MDGKPSYYSILTANVRYDNRLKANEKLLYSEITALSNKYGYCTAGNEYFSKLYNVSERSITRWIGNLKEFGYLKYVPIYKNDSKKVIERRLYPLANSREPLDKIVYVGRQNCPKPLDKNVEDNITSINTINNNITTTTDTTEIKIIYEFWESNIGNLSPYLYEEIQAIYEDWKEVSKQPKEMILESIKMALDKGIQNISYIKSILKRWYDNRIYNIEDLKADQERFEKNKESKYNKQAKKGNAAGYDAKQWTYLSEEEEMRRFFGDKQKPRKKKKKSMFMDARDQDYSKSAEEEWEAFWNG